MIWALCLLAIQASESFSLPDEINYAFGNKTYVLLKIVTDAFTYEHICPQGFKKLMIDSEIENEFVHNVSRSQRRHIFIGNNGTTEGYSNWKFTRNSSFQFSGFAILEYCSGKWVHVNGFAEAFAMYEADSLLDRDHLKMVEIPSQYPRKNIPSDSQTKVMFEYSFRGIDYLFIHKLKFGDQHVHVCKHYQAVPVIIGNAVVDSFIFEKVRLHDYDYFIGVYQDLETRSQRYVGNGLILDHGNFHDGICMKTSEIYTNTAMSNCDGNWYPTTKYDQKYLICQRQPRKHSEHKHREHPKSVRISIIFFGLFVASTLALWGFTFLYKTMFNKNNLVD